MTPSELGKIILLAGLCIAFVGLELMLAGKVPFLRLGHLPGDIFIERKSFSFYFPLTTSLLISIILSLIFWFITRR